MKLNWLKYKKSLFVVLGAIFLLALSGCTGLFPQFTYQGLLTDQNGNPISDPVTITYKLYNDDTGGDLIYTDTNTAVDPNEDGLFNTVVGPDALIAGLSPEDLAQPLWVEVVVGNGVITETLTPRQRLYGSPYAFTLMPGAVISSTMDTDIFGVSGINAITSVYNTLDGDAANPALPALGAYGERSLQLGGFTQAGGNPAGAEAGTIYSADSNDSDLLFYSSDEIWFHLDYDQASDSSTSFFRILNGAGATVWYVDEAGNHTAATFQTPIETTQGDVTLLSVQSPEAWFEDFGSGALKSGALIVDIDPLFAQTINLDVDYHVFLTPLGDCNGLYVTNKTAAGFEVRELGGGTSNVSFDYRIIAKRSGYENNRLEVIDMQANMEEK
ncbi:MAG: hypothetical protein ABIG63_22385 [Chloroflexota bacterium]